MEITHGNYLTMVECVELMDSDFSKKCVAMMEAKDEKEAASLEKELEWDAAVLAESRAWLERAKKELTNYWGRL